MLITANNPTRKSWLSIEKDSDFPIQNIPFGVFLTRDDIITIGTELVILPLILAPYTSLVILVKYP